MNTYAEPSDPSGRVDKLTRALEHGESGSAAVCGAPQSEGEGTWIVYSTCDCCRPACSLMLSLAAASPAYSQEQPGTGSESTEHSLQTITVTGG